MAVSSSQKKYEQKAPVASGYSGMKGVSASTSAGMQKYQQGYKPGQGVQQAQQNLQNVQAQKPQGYTSKYGAQLDNILAQIQNPGQFKYEFNGDNLFKAYADMYTQQGKQASLDTMGQAAAMTGGYGNSYAQAAANQGYQQYLLGLYDKGMDLRNAAYQQYQDRIGNMQNAYGMMADAEAQNYGQYRDTVSDWQRQEENAYGRMADERNFEYNDYANMLNYYTGLAEIENRAYNTEAERQEAIRQYEQNFAENQRQFNAQLEEQQRQSGLDEKYRRDTLTEQRRQADMDNSYRHGALAEQRRQADMDNDYRNRTLGWQQATDARDFNESVRQANLDNNYRNRTLEEQIRQANLDNSYRNRALEEQIRQADLDEAYRQATLEWNKETDTRDYDEAVRQANLDEAYRRDTFDWQKEANQRDYEEAVRQANADNEYRQNAFDWQKETDQRDYEEAVRQADLDEAYRQGMFDWNKETDQRDYEEAVRQADLDEAYRQNAFDWQQATDARDYERSVMESDRNYYTNYAAQMFANGEMPSAEMLAAIGLSEEDARKLLAQVQTIIYQMGPDEEEEKEPAEEAPAQGATQMSSTPSGMTLTVPGNPAASVVNASGAQKKTMTIADGTKKIQQLIADALNPAKNKK